MSHIHTCFYTHRYTCTHAITEYRYEIFRRVFPSIAARFAFTNESHTAHALLAFYKFHIVVIAMTLSHTAVSTQTSHVLPYKTSKQTITARRIKKEVRCTRSSSRLLRREVRWARARRALLSARLDGQWTTTGRGTACVVYSPSLSRATEPLRRRGREGWM